MTGIIIIDISRDWSRRSWRFGRITRDKGVKKNRSRCSARVFKGRPPLSRDNAWRRGAAIVARAGGVEACAFIAFSARYHVRVGRRCAGADSPNGPTRSDVARHAGNAVVTRRTDGIIIVISYALYLYVYIHVLVCVYTYSYVYTRTRMYIHARADVRRKAHGAR